MEILRCGLFGLGSTEIFVAPDAIPEALEAFATDWNDEFQAFRFVGSPAYFPKPTSAQTRALRTDPEAFNAALDSMDVNISFDSRGRIAVVNVDWGDLCARARKFKGSRLNGFSQAYVVEVTTTSVQQVRVMARSKADAVAAVKAGTARIQHASPATLLRKTVK